MTPAVALQSMSIVAPGEILAGKYRVESIIGEGGMGVVVCAMHIQLEQRVAVKFLRQDVLRDAQVTARFMREAKAAAKIRSEHVARVLDVGALDNGAPYMVMEYLEGNDLKHAIRENGVLPAEVAARYVLQACEAIAEAHAAGIIHRDLKPANLFLAKQPGGEVKVKVLDFGISKDVDATLQGLTHSHSLMGTPYYMSPEQLTAPKDVDPRTDVWSLGIILFELLSGLPPYRGATLPEVVASVLRSAPPSHRLPPGVPDSIRKVIDRCLLHSLKSRYQNVAELVADLAETSPSQGQASSARIRHVLQLSRDVPAGAGPSVAELATQDVDSRSVESGPPTKIASIVAIDQTVDSWQAPSVSRSGEVERSSKRKFGSAAAAVALIIAGVGTWAGVRASQARALEPSAAVGAPPPMIPARDNVDPPPSTGTVLNGQTVGSSGSASAAAPSARPKAASTPAAPPVASANAVGSAKVTPKPPTAVPANPLDLRIQ